MEQELGVQLSQDVWTLKSGVSQAVPSYTFGWGRTMNNIWVRATDWQMQLVMGGLLRSRKWDWRGFQCSVPFPDAHWQFHPSLDVPPQWEVK